ncbi:hypothetical protein IUY40_11790 [Flavobacterium sp. ALJ2]|uniref:hypothetical protein n=1 Tax=Flavobacterium sp. ALJ2 TaxID=2786960 RepID=UPI00189CA885|nr:hypothetical protein [Flavobacterium sp. ALJ2]MBF7092221.1 hypothetical protein [Flavobacterium sp. ALJ2]
MKLKHLVLIVFVSVFLSRCASGATIEGMTVKDYKSEKRIGDKIFIKPVIGGEETSPFGISKISNKNFEEAFKKSILDSNFFSKISSTTDDDWIIEMSIVSVDKPKFGFVFTVKSVINYKLYYKNKLVFSKNINQTGRATFSDAQVGVKRVRIANEFSAKNNIKSLFESLNEMALDNVDLNSVGTKLNSY